MPRGKTKFYKQGHWGLTFSAWLALFLAGAAFAVSAHVFIAHLMFGLSCIPGGVAVWITIGYFGFPKTTKAVGLIFLGLSMFVIDSLAVGYGVDAKERDRAQRMFVVDRSKPLMSLYAIMKLDRTHDASDFTNCYFDVLLSRSFGQARDQVIGMVFQYLLSTPISVPKPVPSIEVTTVSMPPIEQRSDILVYNYFSGLNRIELGMYPRSEEGDRRKTLDDLDRSMVLVTATKPLSRSVHELLVVANGYVIVDLLANDFRWRASRTSDFLYLPISRSAIGSSETMDSSSLLNLSLADVDVTRRKRPLEELLTPGAVVHQVNMGSLPRNHHGWMITDAERDQP